MWLALKRCVDIDEGGQYVLCCLRLRPLSFSAANMLLTFRYARRQRSEQLQRPSDALRTPSGDMIPLNVFPGVPCNEHTISSARASHPRSHSLTLREPTDRLLHSSSHGFASPIFSARTLAKMLILLPISNLSYTSPQAFPMLPLSTVAACPI